MDDSKRPASPLRQRLSEDHARLETLTKQFIACIRDEDLEGVASTWQVFERELTGHLDHEERHLLPSFDGVAPQDAARLRREHDRLRTLIAQVTTMIAASALQVPIVIHLIHELRVHAAIEETTLYRLADRILPELENLTPREREP